MRKLDGESPEPDTVSSGLPKLPTTIRIPVRRGAGENV